MRASDFNYTPTRFLLSVAALVLASVPGCEPAHAHDAPTGWRYDLRCCSNRDCAPVEPREISERADGIHIATTGEVISYGDRRIHESPDGMVHVCRNPDKPQSRTICVYLPPRGM